MDKFPLLWEGRPLGELTAERQGQSLWLEICCRLPAGKGPWCAWIVGDRGDLRLGVLESSGGGVVRLRRQFSDRLTQPVGRLLRGELRPVGGAGAENWESAEAPERLFQTAWLRQRLRGVQGILARREGERLQLAIPYDKGNSFPLVSLVCFARLRSIRERFYIVYSFDEREQPVL